MAAPIEVDLAGLTLRAVSIAGVETCIEVPSFKIAFDIGKCSRSATRWPNIFFTHGHVDHLGGLAHHVGTREMHKNKPPTYWIGKEYTEGMRKLLEAWRMLNHSELSCEVRGVSPGDVLDIGKNRRMKVFRSVHRVPTLGYALQLTKNPLLPEHRGKTNAEIVELRRRGVPIAQPVESTELAFCGDTTIDVVDREAVVRTARRLVLECTFLDDKVPKEWAKRTGHIHLDQICERDSLFENEVILLTHFSQRYSAPEIQSILARRLPASLVGRVRPLLAGFRRN